MNDGHADNYETGDDGDKMRTKATKFTSLSMMMTSLTLMMTSLTLLTSLIMTMTWSIAVVAALWKLLRGKLAISVTVA